jgi:hypothetical protein
MPTLADYVEQALLSIGKAATTYEIYAKVRALSGWSISDMQQAAIRTVLQRDSRFYRVERGIWDLTKRSGTTKERVKRKVKVKPPEIPGIPPAPKPSKSLDRSEPGTPFGYVVQRGPSLESVGGVRGIGAQSPVYLPEAVFGSAPLQVLEEMWHSYVERKGDWAYLSPLHVSRLKSEIDRRKVAGEVVVKAPEITPIASVEGTEKYGALVDPDLEAVRQFNAPVEDVKVKRVGKKVLKDYAGMNREAAKAFGFKPLPQEGEVFVSKELKGKEFRATVKHEIVEQGLMKNGSSYWPAHEKALKSEKYASPDIDLPVPWVREGPSPGSATQEPLGPGQVGKTYTTGPGAIEEVVDEVELRRKLERQKAKARRRFQSPGWNAPTSMVPEEGTRTWFSSEDRVPPPGKWREFPGWFKSEKKSVGKWKSFPGWFSSQYNAGLAEPEYVREVTQETRVAWLEDKIMGWKENLRKGEVSEARFRNVTTYLYDQLEQVDPYNRLVAECYEAPVERKELSDSIKVGVVLTVGLGIIGALLWKSNRQ